MIGCPLENHPGHKNRDTPLERAVGKRAETGASHVNADTVAGMLGRLHFVLCLDGNVPSVGLSGNRHILGLALNEAASLVFDPADAQQIKPQEGFSFLSID